MGSGAWDPELRRTWSSACDGAVRAILLSPRGKVAAATASSVLLFDGPPKFELRRELRGQPAGLTAAAFSCKGTDVVSGGADGFLKWWQVDSGEELCSTQFPLGDGQQAGGDLSIPEVACSRGGFVAAVSGRLLCIFGPGGEHLHTLDVSGGEPAGALQHVTWLDESSVLGCCGSEATIWRVDQEQYEEVGTFATNPEAAITQMAMSPNGRYLAAACGNGTVRAGPAAASARAPGPAGLSLLQLAAPGPPCAPRPARFEPLAAHALPSALQVQVWDAQQEGSMDPLLVISEGLGDAGITKLSWDASSALLAAAAGGEVLVWDVAGAKEGRVESSFACGGFAPGARVTCLAFQPSGALMVSGACAARAGAGCSAPAFWGRGEGWFGLVDSAGSAAHASSASECGSGW